MYCLLSFWFGSARAHSCVCAPNNDFQLFHQTVILSTLCEMLEKTYTYTYTYTCTYTYPYTYRAWYPS